MDEGRLGQRSDGQQMNIAKEWEQQWGLGHKEIDGQTSAELG